MPLTNPVTKEVYADDPNFPPEDGASFPAGGPGVLTRAVEDGEETWEEAPPAAIVDGSVTPAKLSFDPATQAELDAHVNDTTDAHDATAISYAGGTGMSATDVEAAIDELATEKSNAADLTAHLNDTTDAHDASAISFAPAGTIAATDVQAAVAEVATEAASALSTHSADTTAQHGVADFSAVPVVLIDDGAGNYSPSGLRTDHTRPREFRGPTAPDVATGVTMNSTPFMDTWVETS